MVNVFLPEGEMYLLEGPSPTGLLFILVLGLLVKRLSWVSAVCCGMALCSSVEIKNEHGLFHEELGVSGLENCGRQGP